MKFVKVLAVVIFLLDTAILASATQQKKIVALMQVRNEENFLEQHLHALSYYVDAMVIVNDASTDKTAAILEANTEKYKIEKIITHEVSSREAGNESDNSQILLEAGRAIGGTHFIVIDADEMFSANCLNDNCLRNTILTLQPGESLEIRFTQLWRSVNDFRLDDSFWSKWILKCIFCDERGACYEKRWLHSSRVPSNLSGRTYRIANYTHNLLHFQFVNWQNLLIKQAWYRCLEHVRNPKKSVDEINKLYGISKDESNLGLKKCPSMWFKNYSSFFDPSLYDLSDNWRKQQVVEWFSVYGKEYFKDLDIWDVNWSEYYSQSGQDKFVYENYFMTKEDGIFIEIGAHDGLKYSNTAFFEKKLGWQGICIEPLPIVFKELQKNRNCICINGCIAKENGQKEFLAISGYPEMLSGLVDSYHPNHLHRIKNEVKQYNADTSIMMINCYKLNDLLKQYKIEKVDFLSIDTEGSEFDILKSIDFENIGIEIISVENNYKDLNIQRFLESKGYQFVKRLEADEIYKKIG